METDEDFQSMTRIREGDEQGLIHLMEKYRETVFRVAMRYADNESDAAELTVDTFHRVYKNAHRFKPTAKVRTWIFSITENLCRDFLRKNKKFKKTVSLNFNPSGNGHSYDECAEVLKTNRKTVETRIYRARQSLRKALASLKEPS